MLGSLSSEELGHRWERQVEVVGIGRAQRELGRAGVRGW